MKPISTTAVLAAMAVALISSSSVQAQTTLTMWSRQGEALPALVEAFNSGHETQVDLQLVPSDQMVQKYATSAAGGSAPDIIGLDLIYTPAFAAAGQLEDLSSLAQGLPYFDQLSKAHVEAGSYDGKIYGLPLLAEGSVLIWNKDLFRQAGIDPEKAPTNWAEIEAAAAAVDALGGDINGFYFAGACGGCNAFTFLPLVWASGGDIFADDGKTVTLDTPQMLDAVNFFRGMVEKGYVPESAETDSGSTWLSTFTSGNIGISQSGAFAIGTLNNEYPDLDYGITFLPGKDGGRSSFGGGDNFAISAGHSADKLDAITEFVNFLYSVEGQTIMAGHGSLPTRADVAAEALKDQDPRYAIAAEAMSIGRTPSSPVYNDLINSPTGPWAQMLTEAFFGDDPAGAITYAQETMQGIVDGFGQ
ncbi:ABC transporter substrate-binding protein [Devosia lacusdianchii]|jgi:multiple sugar transport system substrate-binding protein|uniref:ABC transporter substrate-binding protein n=1 Tax=Devosia lacusdianchii TaxID=2917991 RepID=UPI003B849503